MPYVLGIDIGGTSTTAAVSRLHAHGWGEPEAVRLGIRGNAVPSVLHMGADGTLTVGEPARPDATRLARGFSRRIGDDVPLLVGDEPCTPQALTAILAMWVVERVLADEGEVPEQVVISHPASWGKYRRELLHRALWDIGLGNVTLLPEPVLAAERHAALGVLGGTLAVYSLGGSGYEASAVSWADPVGFRLLGTAAPIDRFGGDDLDDALAALVRGKLGRELRELDGPQVRMALFGLRDECTRAKERLSVEPETDVPVHLPRGHLRVPVTRTELDAAVRPAVRHTVDTLVRTIHTAGLDTAQVDAVVLVGGAVRMPLVTELIAAAVPVPVAVDADPQCTAAAGAALAAAQLLAPPVTEYHDPVWTAEPPALRMSNPEPPPYVNEGEMGAAPPPRPPLKITPLKLPRMRSGQRIRGLVGGRP